MRIIKITQDRGERKSSLPNVGVKSNWKQEYINQYGEHFNDKLADFAILHLKNVDGTSHVWTMSDIAAEFKAAGVQMPEKSTRMIFVMSLIGSIVTGILQLCRLQQLS